MIRRAQYPVTWFLSAVIPALVTGCFGSGSSPSGGKASAQGSPVVITGAISKSFVPRETTAVKISDSVSILLKEDDVFGVSVQFPLNKPPGTYPIGDHLNLGVVEISGEYIPEEMKSGLYLSTQGTLNLTASDGKYSGNFEFNAGHNRDHSKIIQIKGSFADVSLP